MIGEVDGDADWGGSGAARAVRRVLEENLRRQEEELTMELERRSKRRRLGQTRLS